MDDMVYKQMASFKHCQIYLNKLLISQMSIKVRFWKLLTGPKGYNSNDRIFEILSLNSTA